MIAAGVVVGLILVFVILNANHKPTRHPVTISTSQQSTIITGANGLLFSPSQPPPFTLAILRQLSPPPNCAKVACLALTFDDGPNPASTPIILDSLEAADAHATFFEIGRYIKGNESLLLRMSRDGDDIGNHSWSHPDFTKLTPPQIRSQINKTQRAVTNLGLSAPKMFRPPYEYFQLSMLRYIKMPVILWNVDPKDWAQKKSSSVARIVEQQARPGAIIVMHDKTTTADALAKILRDLAPKYQFVSVSELLNLKARSRGIYIGL